MGTEVSAGAWRNSDSSGGCYWARLRGFSGELDDIITNNFSDSIQTVTINPTDAGFSSERCGTWSQTFAPTPSGPPTVTPTPTPGGPTSTPTPGENQPPAFPSTFQWSGGTQFQYDDLGRLIGAVTTITIDTPASDPDGDPLTYTWSATNGSISGSGLTATWTRVITFGRVAPGTATVTVSDGRGGSDTFAWHFN